MSTTKPVNRPDLVTAILEAEYLRPYKVGAFRLYVDDATSYYYYEREFNAIVPQLGAYLLRDWGVMPHTGTDRESLLAEHARCYLQWHQGTSLVHPRDPSRYISRIYSIGEETDCTERLVRVNTYARKVDDRGQSYVVDTQLDMLLTLNDDRLEKMCAGSSSRLRTAEALDLPMKQRIEHTFHTGPAVNEKVNLPTHLVLE